VFDWATVLNLFFHNWIPVVIQGFRYKH
jgi:hypothetical protein